MRIPGLDAWLSREPEYDRGADPHVPFVAVSPCRGVWEVVDWRDGGEDAPPLSSFRGIDYHARMAAETEARRMNDLIPSHTADGCEVCGDV